MTGPESFPAAHQHGLLQVRGGAAAVAADLHADLAAFGVPMAQSFEVRERSGGAGTELLPEEVGRAVPAGALLHLHGTRDWEVLLAGLLGRPGPLLLTLHDCAAFTGGCPYPLDCREHLRGCAAACPRGFVGADRAWRNKRELLRALRPLLVAPSRWLAREAEAVLDLPVAVVPNGVAWPADLPDKAAARRAAGLDPAARVALFAAHGGPEAAYKAGDRWFGLWERIAAQVPDLVGIMAGGRTLERRNNLLVLPYLERERLADFMAAADVFLYPTLADNHPLVVLEAMARGCAVAAFAAGGVPEQVEHERTGLLVRTGDWAGFAATAIGLLAPAGAGRRLGRAAHAEGRRRFSLERMAADYLGLYRAALSADPRPRAAAMKDRAAAAAGR